MLNSLYKDVNIGTCIKFQRFRRIEYLQQMDKVRNCKKIQQTNLHKKRTKGGARWKDNVQNNIRSGDKQHGTDMDGEEQVGRRLSFLDGGDTQRRRSGS